jgi:hypothetical protein
MDLRFYLDPETGEPHIYGHGVAEEEVEEAGRVLRVIFVPDSVPNNVFVVTAYDLTLAAYRRRCRQRRRR